MHKENTIDAFTAALSAGATHIETDVRSTKDNVAVLVHDPVIEGKTVEDTYLKDLPSYVPTLQSALESLPLVRFNIDVKSAKAVRPTAAVIQELDAVERVLITSFSNRRRKKTLHLIPGVATSISASQFVVAIISARLRLTFLLRKSLRNIDAIQIPTRALKIDTTSAKIIRSFHECGVFVYFWTVNDAKHISALLNRGADGIVTDRTDVALSVINQINIA